VSLSACHPDWNGRGIGTDKSQPQAGNRSLKETDLRLCLPEFMNFKLSQLNWPEVGTGGGELALLRLGMTDVCPIMKTCSSGDGLQSA
jgi:hypothetical protein